ncbi:MAG: ATP-dependent helicase [Saprospiraceae bacterium]|nr:ATP-dependent helicase [Saprospiraceae bacterium]
MPNSTENQQAVFTEILQQLNPQQKKAVELIEGPVLVVAGPGTGKTHILSARIGQILTQTDTAAQNILCLTFTDAGVHAMRKRLIEFIGPEAHRVHIYTFHSFCNSIIQDNLEYFGRNDLEPLSDLERIDIIRDILEALPVDHVLRLGRSNMYFYERHLFDLFRRMKMEDWTPDFLNKKTDEYLRDIPSRPEYTYRVNRGKNKKGDPKTAQLEEEKLRMKRFRAAVDLYPQYEKALKKAGRYDYDDMILWVLQAFREHPMLLRNYQEQYLYLLIDEYQDTNGAQNEIIRQLISYWENPNLFIVGDDDQSIYEFQGARLKNLLDIFHQYESSIELIVLEDNYRSSQVVLDSSAHLIGHNQKRIIKELGRNGLKKSLRAQHPAFAKLDTPVQVHVYPGRLQEEVGILQQIEQAQQNGVSLEEIAVIYAKHRQAENLIRLLEKKGIPYTTRRKVNILNLPLIQQIRTLLRYLKAEQQLPFSGEYLLFQILHFQFLNIAPADNARLSRFLAHLPFGKRPSWRETIGDAALLQQAGVQKTAAYLAFSQMLEQLIGAIANISLPHLIERLINRSGILIQITEAEDRIWQTEVIRTFMQFVEQETARAPRLNLTRLLDILDRMDDNRISLEVQKSIIRDKGVQLLTAHSAKGLEFEYVFIMDAVKDQWEPRSSNSMFRFKYPDTVTLSGEEDSLEARRRLFYVAMTRAKSHLFISYSEQNEKGKELLRSQFVDELSNLPGVVTQQKTIADADLLEAQLLHLQETADVQLAAVEKDKIRELVDGMVLSVSALNKYLRCPLSFYYENVLRIPGFNSEAASYGTAMHNALQWLFEQMKASKEYRFPTIPDFISYFEYEMKKQRGFFSAKEYRRRLEMGRTHLAAFYKENLTTWHRKVKLELAIRNVEIDGVPITGIIDKLELHTDQKVVIVDYKTGSHSDRKTRKPGKTTPHGGNYWRQLLFYKILYEASEPTGKTVTTGHIAYLEPDAKGEFPRAVIELREKDARLVRSLIKETYAHIQQHHFYEGCGESSCSWCNFARQHLLVDSFVDPEIEALDDKKK